MFGKVRRLRVSRRVLLALLVAAGGIALGAAGMALLNPFGARGPLAGPSLTGSPQRPLDAQDVYNRVAPSVLDITAVLRYDGDTAEGTGFVFDGARDLVLTNNHVIKDATSVTATCVATGKTYRASVVGTDTAADIAVLRLAGPARLATAPIGDSRDVQLGDQVMVIGNQAGRGGPATIAPGIINSLNRSIEAADDSGGFTETLHDMLQTSARIEPGDSGGPLADASGQVIGVDTAMSTGADAVGFALPVDAAVADARRIAAGRRGPGIGFGTGAFLGVLVAARPPASPRAQSQPSLTDHGVSRPRPNVPNAHMGRQESAQVRIRAAEGVGWERGWGEAGAGHALESRAAVGPPRRAFAVPGRGAGTRAKDGPSCLGTESEAAMPPAVAPVRSGAVVEGVLCGTPAAASGLAPGDVIVRAAGRVVSSPGGLNAIVTGCEPGTRLPVTWVDLGGVTRTALIRVAVAPAP